MVRAVGTMGVVAAIAGGISFAALTSNTVALSPNTLASDTASLQLAAGNGTSCAGATGGPVTGMNFKLAPGVTSDQFKFCLKNNGDISLNLSVAIPQGALTGSQIPPSDVTLALTCDNGGSSSGTLDQYTGGTPLGALASGASTDCQATATLSASYGGTGGQTVNSFDIDFVGTQPSVT